MSKGRDGGFYEVGLGMREFEKEEALNMMEM